MKLVRLTTDDPKAIFNSFLHQDLEIAPYSKIALGKLAVEIDDEPLVIDNENRLIRIQFITGTIKDIRLNFGSYTLANYLELYQDIESKINQALGTLNGFNKIQFPNEIGKTCQVTKNLAGKTQISVRQALSSSYMEKVHQNAPTKYIDSATQRKSVLAPTNAFTILTSSAETHSYDFQPNGVAVADKSQWLLSAAQEYPIARGCGIHRVKIHEITNKFGEGLKGFAISLHTQHPNEYLSSRNMIGDAPVGPNVSDIAYGIKLPLLNGVYSTIINGVATASTLSCNDNGGFAGGQGYYGSAAANNVDNDTVGIEINDGVIRFVVYRTNPAGDNGVDAIVLGTAPYPTETIDGVIHSNTKPLYASYTFFGAGLVTGNYGCALRMCRYTPDYYAMSATAIALESKFQEAYTDHILGNTNQTTQITRATKHSIKFTGEELHTFLGFQYQRQPAFVTDFILSKGVDFISEYRLSNGILNDCILVELNNMQVESYDAFEDKRQRVNVLSVIPYDDTNLNILYSPNNLIFLDLNNQHPIRLSSFKARLVRGDYTDLNVKGLTSMVVYIQ